MDCLKRIAVLIVAAGLLACTVAPREPEGEVREIDALLERLEGAWSNAAQYEAAPDAVKRPPAAGYPYDWLDVQHATFRRVSAPALGEYVVYLEWKSGAADGEISRQRLWVFRTGLEGELLGMDFYTLGAPERLAGRGEEAGAFESLTVDDLVGYPEGCTLAVERPEPELTVLSVGPGSCVIEARSGRRMGIRAEIRIAPGAVTYSEAGVLPDGSYAFMVPGGMPYEFRPLL